MTDMMERVARAIAEALEEEWDMLFDTDREEYRISARAAIKEMRDPTEVMLAAANGLPVTRRIDGLLHVAGAHGARLEPAESNADVPLCQMYRAMFDAALARDAEAAQAPLTETPPQDTTR